MTALYLGLFALSAAMLGLEITLTRVFALAHWYHFAFMAISVALLGLGAGGTLLALRPALRRRPRPVAMLACIGFAMFALCSYLAANWIPFDAYRIALEPVQFVYLAAYYLLLSLPFFWASVSIGVVLAAFPLQGHRVYAANLLGSAAGGALAPSVLSPLGGPGAVACWAAVGGGAAVLFATSLHQLRAAGLGLGAALLCTNAILAWLRPPWLDVRLSPYKALPQTLQTSGSRLLWQGWNSLARVDVVHSPSVHVAPGMSLGCAARQPDELALFVDGDSLSARLEARPLQIRDWAECLPLSLPFGLRPSAAALIVQPEGNLDTLVAQAMGAKAVTVVEPNALLVRAAGGHSGAQVEIESGRSFLRGAGRKFDVIDLALTGSRNVVTTGAYSLGEEYLYTVEAFSDALSRLQRGGLLVIARWLQTPPSESLRAWTLAVAALERSGVPDVRARLVAIRSWSTMLILIKNGRFSASELSQIRAFCSERQFDLVYLPDMDSDAANRFNVYPGAPYSSAFQRLVESDDRSSFYATQDFDIRPPTDDHPFFFHFFKWKQVPSLLRELGHTWRPFGGGGYLVLVAILLVACVSAAALALSPLAFGVGRDASGRGMALAYFALIGLGFLAVEVPLLQRLTLLLGHPTVAFAVVVASLLLFSGVGSLLSQRIGWLVGLVGLALSIPLTAAGVSLLEATILGTTLPVRVLASGLCLAPLGLLLGVPFARGLGHLVRTEPNLVPWAWAVNGSASVVASVGVALGALALGFSAVLAVGSAAYVGAAMVAARWRRPSVGR